MSLSQQAKKVITVFGGVIDPDYQGEIGLILHNGEKGDYVWSAGDPWRSPLMLPCPVIRADGKLLMDKTDSILRGEAILLKGQNMFISARCKIQADCALACFWNLIYFPSCGVLLTPWIYPDKIKCSEKQILNIHLSSYITEIPLETPQPLKTFQSGSFGLYNPYFPLWLVLYFQILL